MVTMASITIIYQHVIDGSKLILTFWYFEDVISKWPKSQKYSIPLTKILPAILQKTLFFRFDPGKWLKIQKNILNNFRFIAAILIFFRFRANHDFVTPGDTPVPVKTLFLDFRPGKTHIGPKNNSKQLLRRWCYTHFFSFARKSRYVFQKSASLADFSLS